MSELYLKSPTQAVAVYGLDGPTVVRTKNLFYVRFRRADNGQVASDWQNDIGFIVKQIDRPSVNPIVEEVNQYNKKRLVTTGYTMTPVNLTVHDTVDNIAMRMWDEYSRYYYADFNQDDDSSHRYDATLSEMAGNEGGFGYYIRPDQLNNDAQFFFDAVEVYQVFGGYFTQYDLINPRITAFNPDDLDYSVVEAATITMTLQYESIKYRNNGRPTAIADNELMASVFAGRFNGNVLDLKDVPPRSAPQQTGSLNAEMVARATGPQARNLNEMLGQMGTNTRGGGALGMFGNYDFGTVGNTVVNTVGATVNRAIQSGDLSYLGSDSAKQTTIRNLQANLRSAVTSMSSHKVDSVAGAVGAGNLSPHGESYVQQNVLTSVLATASATGTPPSSQVSNTNNALGVSSAALSMINARRPQSSQLGFNLGGIFGG